MVFYSVHKRNKIKEEAREKSRNLLKDTKVTGKPWESSDSEPENPEEVERRKYRNLSPAFRSKTDRFRNSTSVTPPIGHYKPKYTLQEKHKYEVGFGQRPSTTPLRERPKFESFTPQHEEEEKESEHLEAEEENEIEMGVEVAIEKTDDILSDMDPRQFRPSPRGSIAPVAASRRGSAMSERPRLNSRTSSRGSIARLREMSVDDFERPGRTIARMSSVDLDSLALDPSADGDGEVDEGDPNAHRPSTAPAVEEIDPEWFNLSTPFKCTTRREDHFVKAGRRDGADRFYDIADSAHPFHLRVRSPDFKKQNLPQRPPVKIEPRGLYKPNYKVLDTAKPVTVDFSKQISRDEDKTWMKAPETLSFSKLYAQAKSIPDADNYNPDDSIIRPRSQPTFYFNKQLGRAERAKRAMNSKQAEVSHKAEETVSKYARLGILKKDAPAVNFNEEMHKVDKDWNANVPNFKTQPDRLRGMRKTTERMFECQYSKRVVFQCNVVRSPRSRSTFAPLDVLYPSGRPKPKNYLKTQLSSKSAPLGSREPPHAFRK
eukprot:GFYU01011963.1.p1 GENE.GFYU01011963.1~~GFYU01011963.1.p1  ORF type:complete len:544 (-),score=93.84 GFYU01011963.1:546-2177(-)